MKKRKKKALKAITKMLTEAFHETVMNDIVSITQFKEAIDDLKKKKKAARKYFKGKVWD